MTYQVCVEDCCEGDGYDHVEKELSQMTFWAHRKLLFEKIKQKIEEKEGKKLSELADLLVDAAKEQWQNESEHEKKTEALRKKIRETF